LAEKGVYIVLRDFAGWPHRGFQGLPRGLIRLGKVCMLARLGWLCLERFPVHASLGWAGTAWKGLQYMSQKVGLALLGTVPNTWLVSLGWLCLERFPIHGLLVWVGSAWKDSQYMAC